MFHLICFGFGQYLLLFLIKLNSKCCLCCATCLVSLVYFKRLFLDYTSKRATVILPEEISMSTLSTLVDFIYTGEVQILEEDLKELIEAAESLEIQGLTNKSTKVGSPNTSRHSPVKVKEIQASI